MKAVRNDLWSVIETSASDLAMTVDTVVVESPADASNGDYTTNCAMVWFGKLRKLSTDNQWKKPSELAHYLAEQFSKASFAWLDRVEVVEPGFINFYLSKDFLAANLGFLTNLSGTAESMIYNGQNVVVEFTDPNPFKEFHIGHLYSNTVGESISRLLEAMGATVWRADYFGDVGMHVAKSIWGLRKKMAEEPVTLAELGAWPLAKRIAFLGQAYALGASAYKDDEQAQSEMKQLNFLVYLAGQERLVAEEGWQPVLDYNQFITPEARALYPEIKQLYFTGRSWSLEYFDSIYARLGMQFDGYYPESKSGEWGAKLVQAELEKGTFKRSQDAVIFEGSAYGLHDRVFLNSMGLPTYEAKELALPKLKQKDFAYDRSIIITGNEITEYFKVLLKALSMIEPEIAAQTTHLGHGMVRLPEGKMSSRTGKVITGSWLLDEAKNEVLKLAKTEGGADQADREEMAELVGQAAIKYAFLKQSVGGDLTFSFSESLDFHGNSGPYLLYSYVRARTVLQQAAEAAQTTIEQLIDTLKNRKDHDAKEYTALEIDLLRKLEGYSAVVEQSALEFAPHHLCTYLFQLAQLYNTWYGQEKIVSVSGDQLSETAWLRLEINLAVSVILKRGLSLLGIRTVEHM